MRSLFCLSLAALLVGAALAAPVPLPRPAPRPWLFGWGAPVDPVGDCRFERDGRRLTITVPGEGHGLAIFSGHLDAPRLFREAEGDFSLEVRVRGGFSNKAREREAGIVLLAGRDGAKLSVGARLLIDEMAHFYNAGLYWPEGGCSSSTTGWLETAEGLAFGLRLERAGGRLRMSFRRPGARWRVLKDEEEPPFELPRKVKVGVFAASTAEGAFKVTFDELKFTQKQRPELPTPG